MRISYWSSDVCSSDLHDVDALAVQFVAHRLNARAAHADAGADRIGAVVVGQHRDLGAVARITRAGLDVDQALADFRHFELERSEEHTSELQSLMRSSYAVFCLRKKQNSRLPPYDTRNTTKHNKT